MELFRLLLTVATWRARQAEPQSEPARLYPALGVTRVLDLLDDLIGIEKTPLLTYGAAIRYFAAQRPNDDRVAMGALIRRPDVSGSLLIWLFLSEDGEPLRDERGRLYGKKALVSEIDEELMECFGDSDLFIVR